MAVAAKLLDHLDLTLPQLPASLEGLRMAHLTDLHTRPNTRRVDRLMSRLAATRLDLVLITGDVQHRRADPSHAVHALRRLTDQVKPALGFFGVWGNHDSVDFRRQSLDLPIHWLADDIHRIPDRHLDILGLCGSTDHAQADSVQLAMRIVDAPPPAPGPEAAGPDDEPPTFRIMLAHYPRHLIQAVELGADLMFCGDTHGGQVRIPPRQAIQTKNDFPLNMSAGLLRSRDTLCVISRGLGESQLRLRLFCPPQLILCTLRKGSMPGRPADGIELIRGW